MQTKSILQLVALLIGSIAGPVAVDKVVDAAVSETPVQLTGPLTCEVGELVVFEVTGENPAWLLPTTDHKVLGHSVVASFRAPGVYEVVVAALSGSQNHIRRVLVTVGQVPVPDPEPDRKPEPKPAPEVSSDMAKQVTTWCAEYEVPKDKARLLGDNFIEAANEAESIDELLQIVSIRNRELDQTGLEPILSKVQKYLFDNLQGASFEEHQTTFSNIGSGLQAYAATEISSKRRK